ncbi:TPA: LOW QUALITY PROTEIN: hypothetical protein N0F65_001168 [Lagenidium giganteum]|uniref:Cyclic nucleotide-binding domain-containing protein n=1 Tax=Lagenidium giganteum TaxID=4803 RepID=A0AAV2YTX6_9STRA|nr:TPA: LOW QUALITY PROTEIN: hypothetical protein N0F65_001168 [Lagenidium giganteum]
MGFIGSRGCVGILDPSAPNDPKVVRILRKGDYFGEMALLERTKRSTTCIALSWVQIHVLCRKELEDVKDLYQSRKQCWRKRSTTTCAPKAGTLARKSSLLVHDDLKFQNRANTALKKTYPLSLSFAAPVDRGENSTDETNHEGTLPTSGRVQSEPAVIEDPTSVPITPKPAVAPHSSRGGARRYNRKSVRVLAAIKLLWGSGRGLDGVKDVEDNQAFNRRCAVDELIFDTECKGVLAIERSRSNSFCLRAQLRDRWHQYTVSPTAERHAPFDSARFRFETVSAHPWIFNHESTSRDCWNVLVYAVTVVGVVLTPLSLSFGYHPKWVLRPRGHGGSVVRSGFWCQHALVVWEWRGVVIAVPAAPWAIPDLFSWFPVELLFFSGSQSRVLGIVKVLRLVRVHHLARHVFSAKRANMVRFLRLFGVVLLGSHCFVCFWHWVATEWRANQPEWSSASLTKKCVHCWALFIDCLSASPPSMHSMIEELTVSFIMLVGNLVQASVFGSVAALISSFDEEEAAYKRKMISTYERCEFLDIPTKLTQRGGRGTIDSIVLEQLVLHLQTVVYMKDGIVMRKGEFGDWMGFVGCSGSVGVLDPYSQQHILDRILRKGDYFGETALLERTRRMATAVALAWVQIHVLCRKDLDEVKDMYPEREAVLEAEIRKDITADRTC